MYFFLSAIPTVMRLRKSPHLKIADTYYKLTLSAQDLQSAMDASVVRFSLVDLSIHSIWLAYSIPYLDRFYCHQGLVTIDRQTQSSLNGSI